MERAFHLAQADGRAVRGDVPMDIFSADLRAMRFKQVPAPMSRPTVDAATVARIVEAARLGGAPNPCTPAAASCRRAPPRSWRACRGARSAGRAHAHGKGCFGGSPAALGQTGSGVWPIANEKCRTADLIVASALAWPKRTRARGNSALHLFGSPTRLIHKSTPTRRRSAATIRPISASSPTRSWPRGARRAARGKGPGIAGHLSARRSARPGEGVRCETGIITGARISIRCGPNGFLPSCGRRFRKRVHRHRRRLEQNGVAQQFSITVPGTFITPSGLATMGLARPPCSASKWRIPDRAAVSAGWRRRVQARTRRSSPRRWRRTCRVVWLVMDNAELRDDRGLESMHSAGASAACSGVGGKPYKATTPRWRARAAHAA